VSHLTAAQVAEARAIAPLACVQDHYNLVHRDDDALVDALAAEGTAFQSMEGISYTTFFPVRELTPEQAAVLDAVARRAGATRTQVALAWLLARSPNVLVIPGATAVAQLEENVAAAALTLDPRDIAELDRLAGIAGAVPPPRGPHAPPTS
jgi:pyridoxine 4-dehydrogenase